MGISSLRGFCKRATQAYMPTHHPNEGDRLLRWMRSACFHLKTHIRDGEQGCRGRPRPVGRVVYCSTIWLFPNKPVTMAEVEGRITDCSRRLTLRASTRYGFRAVATTFENAVLVPP